MKTSELILRQVQYLRKCFKDFVEDAESYAADKNTFELEEALAGTRIISGFFFDEEGQQIPLTNDYARRAYLKDQTVTWSTAMNSSKEVRDASEKKVEVEISVLSALKQIAENEDFDDSLLAKYDLTDNGETP